jgi:type II secretory pathway component GspD/PulD (secretin)
MRPPRPIWVLSLLLAAGGPLPPRAEAQPPAPAAKAELRVFRLKYVPAAEASRMLRELLGDQLGPKGRLRMTAAGRANSLLVLGDAADLDRVAGLLQKIDTEGDARGGAATEVRVFELGRLEPDDALEASLRLVFEGRRAGQFVLDRGRRVVVASADRPTLLAAEALLKRLGGLPGPWAGTPRPGRGGKAYAVEFRDRPWGQVLDWLADQSRLPVVSPSRPTGTFTFLAPGGKTYTLPGVIDLLNEALLSHPGQKYLLIRRERSFLLAPADEKIDPGSIPHVPPEELGGRGKTEVVSVTFPLKSVSAGEVAPDVAKLLGPFGQVVAMKKANRLVVQDTAGNLRRVHELLRDIERKGGE